MEAIEAAFQQVCDQAEDVKKLYVSLYRDDRCYAGPEEGGRYVTDTDLIASQEVYSRKVAEAMKADVHTLAETLTQQAENDRNRYLAQQCEYLEERGVDDYDDNVYLSPPDGGSRFWVAVEVKQGSFVCEADRAYS